MTATKINNTNNTTETITPQVSNTYTMPLDDIRIEDTFNQKPKSFERAVTKARLPLYERAMLDCIAYFAFAYHSLSAFIAYSLFAEFTGITDHRHIYRALKALKEKNIIFIDNEGEINRYTINLDFFYDGEVFTSKQLNRSTAETNSIEPKKILHDTKPTPQEVARIVKVENISNSRPLPTIHTCASIGVGKQFEGLPIQADIKESLYKQKNNNKPAIDEPQPPPTEPTKGFYCSCCSTEIEKPKVETINQELTSTCPKCANPYLLYLTHIFISFAFLLSTIKRFGLKKVWEATEVIHYQYVIKAKGKEDAKTIEDYGALLNGLLKNGYDATAFHKHRRDLALEYKQKQQAPILLKKKEEQNAQEEQEKADYYRACIIFDCMDDKEKNKLLETTKFQLPENIRGWESTVREQVRRNLMELIKNIPQGQEDATVAEYIEGLI